MGQAAPNSSDGIKRIGRYVIHSPIASGGMGSVHLGRVQGAGGFSRVVAIKRMHAHIAQDRDAVASFLDEARLAARIRHPNVVPTLDVVAEDNEIILVMEYIEGDSLQALLKGMRKDLQQLDLSIAVAVMTAGLRGLHAAHEAKSEGGTPLGIVHRDVSPQNLLVGVDGICRVVDFGIAKATQRMTQTAQGVIKGKLSYMAPEQVRSAAVDRRADIYAAGVVLWEAIAGRRLFGGGNELDTLQAVLAGDVAAPSCFRQGIPPALDEIVLKACAREPENRFATAEEFAEALEMASPVASQGVVGRWVKSLTEASVKARAAAVAELESSSMRFGTDIASMPATVTGNGPALGAPPIPTGATGETGFSVVTDRGWGKGTQAAAIIGSVVIALGVAFIVLHDGRQVGGAPAASAVEAAPSAPVAVVVPPPPTAPPSATTPPPAAEVVAVASVTPPTPAVTTRTGKTSGSGAKPPPPAAHAGCDPPYVLLANGRKQFKPECF